MDLEVPLIENGLHFEGVTLHFDGGIVNRRFKFCYAGVAIRCVVLESLARGSQQSQFPKLSARSVEKLGRRRMDSATKRLVIQYSPRLERFSTLRHSKTPCVPGEFVKS